ncbi:MAG: RecX family transcriptional regulator [SAR324 cluster bacterium]|nr:RecX family transcriptional regulator [SAR324 cluster bacterium]
MELFENQNYVSVENVHYANDGTVTLDLSDKRALKLSVNVWSDLGQPRDLPLTDEQLEILEREACYTMIRNKVLSFLAVREHSATELRRKLKQRFFKLKNCDFSALLERCLQEMQERDFQSDERFARRFVESKLANKPLGPFRILQDLQNRGISSELAKTVLNELSDQDLWLKKASECLIRLQKKGKKQETAALSQKLFQRGFAWETIELALENYQTLDKVPATGELDSCQGTFSANNN